MSQTPKNRKNVTPQTPPSEGAMVPYSQQWIRPSSADDWKNIAKYWKTERDKMKNARDTEHQRYIAVNEMVEELKNEFNGLLRKKNVNVEEMVTAEILSDYAAHKDIQDVVHERKPKQWIKFGWEMAFAIVALVVVWQYATNSAFRDGISKNLPILGVLGFAVILVVLFLRQNKGKGK